MPNSWRVMLNSRLWNQSKYEEDFVIRPEVRRLAQSKGRRRMVKCPKKGDMASFVLKGKVVMRGIVESDGFENGTVQDGRVRVLKTTLDIIDIVKSLPKQTYTVSI